MIAIELKWEAETPDEAQLFLSKMLQIDDCIGGRILPHHPDLRPLITAYVYFKDSDEWTDEVMFVEDATRVSLLPELIDKLVKPAPKERKPIILPTLQKPTK